MLRICVFAMDASLRAVRFGNNDNLIRFRPDAVRVVYWV